MVPEFSESFKSSMVVNLFPLLEPSGFGSSVSRGTIRMYSDLQSRRYYTPMQFIEDDKLPTDVVRKEYSESRHALCCLNCGFESEFAPHLPDSIGKPRYVLMVHDCPSPETAD
jgi:hypothetical protein